MSLPRSSHCYLGAVVLERLVHNAKIDLLLPTHRHHSLEPHSPASNLAIIMCPWAAEAAVYTTSAQQVVCIMTRVLSPVDV